MAEFAGYVSFVNQGMEPSMGAGDYYENNVFDHLLTAFFRPDLLWRNSGRLPDAVEVQEGRPQHTYQGVRAGLQV